MQLLQNIKYVIRFYNMYFLDEIIFVESKSILKICIVLQ